MIDASSVSVFQADVAHGSQWNAGNYDELPETQAAVGPNYKG